MTAVDNGSSVERTSLTFNVTISNPLSDVSSGMMLWLKADSGVYEDTGGTDFG